MKKIIVLFLLSIVLLGSCTKEPYPCTYWKNVRDENVVIICNNTFFTMLPQTEYRRDEWETTKPMCGYRYQVFKQTDYLKEHPIQEGVADTYNVINY